MPQRDNTIEAIKRLDACGCLRALLQRPATQARLRLGRYLRVRRWRISPPKRSFCGASLEYAVMHDDEEEAGFFKVVFWRQGKDAGAYGDASVITTKTTAETTAKTTAETTAENSVQSTSSGAALSIWKLICKNPAISISALAAATSLTCDGVRYHIRRLTAQGRLKRIGGTKGGHWEVAEGA